MTEEQRKQLSEEYAALIEKINNAAFIRPKDIRRKEQILSLLMTDGDN